MKISVLLSAGLLAAGLTSCGMFDDDSGKKSSSIIKQNEQGCVQGVVLNGLDGQRLDLKNSDGKQGVHVIVRNKVIRAKTHVDGSKEGIFEGLKGEYYACGIPLDTRFPLIAWKDGYQQFEAEIYIASAVKQETPNSEVADRDLEYPTLLANIYMYPKGTEANDLKFKVVKHGDVVPGARVQLKSTGSNSLHPTRSTLTPQIRSVPTIAKTDEMGEVTFAGGELVLGGIYQYTIIPPEGGTEIAYKSGSVTVGLRKTGAGLAASEPYELVVALDDTATKLTPLAKSTEASDFNEEGKVVIWFNQPIEISPRGEKSYSARISGGEKAQLFKEGTHESMTVQIEGNRLTLTPSWKIAPKAKFDEDLVITYSNLELRPKGDARQANYYTLPSTSIRFFDR